MNEQQALKYLQHFSIITVGENKVPNGQWKQQQDVKLTEAEFIKQFNLPTTKGIGIVTGFDFLECIDVDTKVFSTQIEMNEFWNEFIETLRDSIINFDEKFVIYKTKSGGYHILYKSKRVVGNKKIATLKGHKEALIESRGTGGYIFIYPDKKYGSKSYFEIEFISDSDREILWNVCQTYNYIDEKPIEPKKDKKVYDENDVTPWDDFNSRTDIWDIIQDDFIIPQKGIKKDKYLIKRHNATSPHSGYVFNNSGCAYLFSTGTIYPHQQLISPFLAFAYKFHNGDIKQASKDLYEQGFGTRLKRKVDEIKPILKEEIKVENLSFPVEIYPKEIQHYILECNSKLDSNIDYMGSSLIWLISVCVGNSFVIEVKRGWVENSTVWISVVGNAGIGKTPSINNIINPLQKVNSREIKSYYKELDKYEQYAQLSKKEKQEHIEVFKPKKTQFIANDITLEALIDLHQDVDNSVGVFKDELAGWFKDMNKYRQGSDLEFWLSCWSGRSVTVNRMTRKGSFVEKPLIPVLGGIQPSIFGMFATDENKENGFLDRMLLSFPESVVDVWNENELSQDLIRWYTDSIVRFYDVMKMEIIRDDHAEIVPHYTRFEPDAKIEYQRIFNRITELQNSDNENEYMKSMYPKQKSYIPRFALLLHLFNSYFEGGNMYSISKESVLKAEKLSNYFINCAKKVKFETTEIKEFKTATAKAGTTYEKLKAIYAENPEFNRTKVAELLGVSRKTIINTVKKIEEDGKKS